MLRRFSLVTVTFLALGTACLGTDPAVSSVEQAQQLQTPFRAAAAAPEADSGSPASFAGDPDDDSFGSQQILKSAERIPPFDAFASVSALFTNNVALTHRDTHGDSFLVATFGLSTSRKITDTLQLDFTSSAGLFRYSRFSEFDMESLNVGVGLAYRMPKLWDASLFAQYGFSDLLNGRTNNQFFKNHVFTLGVQKAIGISRALNLTTGVSTDFNLTDPEALQEDDIGCYTGLQADLTRHLQADLDYRYAYQIYTQGTRRDDSQLLSLFLQYTMSNWLSIIGSTYLTVDISNEEVFSYEALVEGFGLSANIAF